MRQFDRFRFDNQGGLTGVVFLVPLIDSPLSDRERSWAI
jgi:hypothetical protein